MADARGPYSVYEKDLSSFRLDGSASYDPDGQVLPSAAYSWDLNSDRVFGDAVGSKPYIGACLLEHGMSDGPNSWPVALRVEDGVGGASTSQTTLTVVNSPPKVYVEHPTVFDPAVGLPLMLTVWGVDWSAADCQAGSTYQIDWGDGTVESFFRGPGDLPWFEPRHTYSPDAQGAVITIAATDKDGGVSDAVVIVLGTSGDDDIIITQGSLIVWINGNEVGRITAPVSELSVLGLDGGDTITVAPEVTVEAKLSGGAGNDTLVAGGGSTVLDGGEGNDTLVGGEGDNTFIGGAGQDAITGGVGVNVLADADPTDTVAAAPGSTMPAAFTDAYQVDTGGVLTVGPAAGVLANDLNPLEGPLTAVLAAGPEHGSLALSSDGAFTYTPHPGFSGMNTFSYRSQNGAGQSAACTASIHVVSRAPTAHDQTISLLEDAEAIFVLSGTDNATAQGNLAFTVKSLPTQGLLMGPDGQAVAVGRQFIGPPTLTFHPGAALPSLGTGWFAFTVTDRGEPDTPGVVGQASPEAYVTLRINPSVGEGAVTLGADGVLRIGGTSGSDEIVVSQSRDGLSLRVQINSVTVADAISLAAVSAIRAWGRDGDDCILLQGVASNAVLWGGRGDDTLTGGAGNDLLFGGSKMDVLTGGAGKDFLVGGEGSDRLVGSAGHDILVAGSLGSTLTEETIRAVLWEWAYGKLPDDGTEDGILDETLITDFSFDQLTGGSGNDWFIIGDGDKITDFKVNKTQQDLITQV